MTDPAPSSQPARSRTGLVLGLAALAGLAVGVGSLYGGGGFGGKADGACPGSAARAAALKPLVTGEVAGFALEDQPRPVPALAFKGPDGAEVTLASMKGRTVLLNLWATWCVPCRREMPALDRLQAEMGSPGFQVTAVNIDTRDTERAGTFLDGIGVHALTRYADPSASVFETLKAEGKAFGMPTSVLVDADGCGLATLAGPADWSSREARALVRAAKG